MWLASASSAAAAPVIDFLGQPAEPCGDAVITWTDVSSPLGSMEEACDASGELDAVIDPNAGSGGGGIALMSALFWPGRTLAGATFSGPPLVNDGQVFDVLDPDLPAPDSPEITTTGVPTGTPTLRRHPPSIDGFGSFADRAPFAAEPASLPSLSPGLTDPGVISPAVVPEPATLLLFGTGLAFLARLRRQRSD